MNILIATDGSEFSSAAVADCCRIFNPSNFTKVKIICVEETVSDEKAFSLPLDYTEMMNKALHAIAEQIVDQTKHELVQILGKTKCLIETEVLSGKPKKAIIEESEKWGADLIVVGSHGKGFWKRMLLGSVSKAVARHAECSVLIGRKDSA